MEGRQEERKRGEGKSLGAGVNVSREERWIHTRTRIDSLGSNYSRM